MIMGGGGNVNPFVNESGPGVEKGFPILPRYDILKK